MGEDASEISEGINRGMTELQVLAEMSNMERE